MKVRQRVHVSMLGDGVLWTQLGQFKASVSSWKSAVLLKVDT